MALRPHAPSLCVLLSCLLGALPACGDTADDDDISTPTASAATPTATATATAVPTPTATAAPTPSGEGTLALTFRIDTDYMDVMDEPAVGSVWAAVYRGEDVTNIGPVPGAVPLMDIYVELVDLTPNGGPTEVLLVTDPLPNIEVAILGFMDSDGNANLESPDPDRKDPVTFPGQNRFDVVADQQTTAEVFFGLLNP